MTTTDPLSAADIDALVQPHGTHMQEHWLPWDGSAALVSSATMDCATVATLIAEIRAGGGWSVWGRLDPDDPTRALLYVQARPRSVTP